MERVSDHRDHVKPKVGLASAWRSLAPHAADPGKAKENRFVSDLDQSAQSRSSPKSFNDLLTGVRLLLPVVA